MKKSDLFLILIISALSLFLLTGYINKPFWGHHDWNSNIWTLVAKNNLNHGILCTKLGQATSFKPITDCSQLQYYMNHPPLITWLLTVFYFLLGFSEWVGRLPFILSSLGSIILIFLIGKRLYNHRMGFFASLFFMATPMFIYFGKSINHEPMVLFSILLALYSYILWIKEKKQKFYYLYLLSAFITGLAGWHGYFFYLILFAITLLYQKEKIKKTFVALLILFFIFFLHQAHTFWVTGSFNSQLISQFLLRTSVDQQADIEGQIAQFSYYKFFIQEIRWLIIYYSRILIFGSFIFILLILKDIFRKRVNFPTAIILGLLAFGLVVPFIFSQQAFIHDYLNIYFLPFFALSMAALLENLKKLLSKKFIAYLSLILVVGVFFERKGFLDALQKREAEKLYVELAQIINKKGSDSEKFLIEANNFYNFAYPFLWNYSYSHFIDSKTDNLDSFLKEKQEIEKQYDFVIAVETNPVEASLIELLDDSYQKEKEGIFTFYKL